MSLTGLLETVAKDPQLRQAVEYVGLTGAGDADLVAPPALRPLLVAALATLSTTSAEGAEEVGQATEGTEQAGQAADAEPASQAGQADAEQASQAGQAAAAEQASLAGQAAPAEPPFVLAITATAREAEDLTNALGSLLPDPSAAAYFPAWETLPHERLSPRSDTSGKRLAVLRRLVHPDPGDPRSGPLQVVATPVRSVLQPLVSGLGELEPVRLEVGDEAELEDVVARLVEVGYARVELVTNRGELAVRGGILDVFPPTEEHPLRVEFFGSEVEEIRPFRAADQRSLGSVAQTLWAPPCRELLLTPAVRHRAKQLAAEYPGLGDVLGRLADGIAVDGMEALAPLLADRMELLFDALPAGAIAVACDPERIRTRAADLVRTSQEFLEASWINAAAGAQVPIDLGGSAFRPIIDVRADAARLGIRWWTITPFAAEDPSVITDRRTDSPQQATDGTGQADDSRGREWFEIAASPAPMYHGETARVIGDVRGWLTKSWRVALVTEGHGPAQRLAELLRGEALGARAGDLDSEPEAGVAVVATGQLDSGFVWPSIKLAVLCEGDLSGVRAGGRDRSRMPSRRRGGIDPLQLTPGDYVVHSQHGVGRYLEMTSRTIQGATREYLVIEYAPSRRGHPPDRLYLPTDQLDEVTRYSGGEAPSLHRLGGADWAKTKGRARKAVREIAAQLIRLYSARVASPGYQFGLDTPWQRELEDAFPYAETPDQLAAIDEIKADMQKPIPMDRLICGDVGYGKTELAVRAAFKAVQDGKQVAVLCPTTLLVQQHMATFGERYGPFPVVLRAMSRFQSDAEVAATQAGLADGTVDIVIGTHRLLSPETRFKNLGLIIIDEEQRFGVEHKEYLKAMRTQVDVLSMSATPIPRTLEMGIAGIREMSTILTPPEERHPVLTFVGPYDEKQIAAAIRRELLRDGQTFFVHNRVASIGKVAARVAELVPEARVAVAHGQMNEHTLEKIMVDFWDKHFDVLVSTTIVESGLDIPNANTLIVDRADAYGLSQLHQLRGRVGRGRERGYAYFLFPPEKPMTETAHERLATVAQHTEKGAGTFIAMKDLEIRGAGNLLGGEQSGHIAGVGFDLYVRMIGEAVNEMRGDGPAERTEVRVELPVDAHIPHDYVPGERLRLEAYTSIAAIESDKDIVAVTDELTDRYGPPPRAVLNLLDVARLRAKARQAGLTDITLQGNHVRFAPVELPESLEVRVQRLYPKTLLKRPVRTMLVPAPKVGGRGTSRGGGGGRSRTGLSGTGLSGRGLSGAGLPGAGLSGAGLSGGDRAGAGGSGAASRAVSPLGAPTLRDAELLAWCEELIEAVFGDGQRRAGSAARSEPGEPGEPAGAAGTGGPAEGES